MKLFYRSICVLLLLSSIFFFIKKRDNLKTGTLVLLNGPSASGKSSIQKAFQKINNELYVTIGIDNFFDVILPDVDDDGRSIKNNEVIRWIEFSKNEQDQQLITLGVGPAGYRVVKGMHRAIAAYIAQNNNVIMDYILYDQKWLPDLINVLKNYRVYLVGIYTPLEIIEQRESKRGTSPIGHARSHYNTVHENMIYDLTLDTSLATPEELANRIKEYISNNPDPKALKQLSLQYIS